MHSGSLDPSAPTRAIDVIITVHEALEDLERCVASVLRHRAATTRIILVNDASGPACSEWLRQTATRQPNVQLIEHERNLGYTGAANSGLRSSTAAHVVLLNSDTVVTAGWLEGLIRCAESSQSIGIVGPLSNAASWQSIPDVFDATGKFAVNELPAGLTIEDAARLVRAVATRVYPRTPLVNGFCFLVKRAVLERVGLFDEVRFPEGYGEENDYCLRARAAGFELAIADDVYVHHAKSKSYGTRRRDELAKVAHEKLKQIHGAARVDASVREVQGLAELERVRARARSQLRPAQDPSPVVDPLRISALFLLPSRTSGGGVHSVIQEATVMRRLGARVQVAVRASDQAFYHQLYPELSEIAELLLPFTPGTLPRLAASFASVIATTSASVELLAQVQLAQPTLLPGYYVQDYEPFFYEEGSDTWRAARASYTRIPNALLFAKTDWIVQTLFEQHGIVAQRVQPSLDHSVFYTAARPTGTAVRIAAMIRPQTPRRNAALTMRVLSEVSKRHGSRVEIHIFGCESSRVEFRPLRQDFLFTNYEVLTRTQVASLLRGCDVFVDFSTYQAFGRTALEAMACGCALIVPQAGGTDEYAEHGVNALVVDTGDDAACFEALSELVTNDAERARLSARGLETAATYSVERAVVSELNMLAAALAARTGARTRVLDAATLSGGAIRATPAPDARVQKQLSLRARQAMLEVVAKIPGLGRHRTRALTLPTPLLDPQNPMSDNKLVRKMKKLVRKPDEFFADSTNSVVRGLGTFWKRRSQNDAAQPASGAPAASPSAATAVKPPTPSKPSKPKPSPAVQQASSEARGGNLQRALELYSAAALVTPDDLDALVGEAGCRFLLGQYEWSREIHERLERQDARSLSLRRSAELSRCAAAASSEITAMAGAVLGVLEPIAHRAITGFILDGGAPSSLCVVLYVDGQKTAEQLVELGTTKAAHGLSFVDFAFSLPQAVCDGAEHQIAIEIEGRPHLAFGSPQRRVISALKLGEFTVSHGYVRGVLLPQAFPTGANGELAEQATVDVLMDDTLVRSVAVKLVWEQGGPRPAFFTQKLPRTASDGKPHEIRMRVPRLATELRTQDGLEAFVFEERVCGQVESMKDGVLTGWAFEVAAPEDCLEVTLFDGDVVIERKLTHLQRSDVNRAFSVDGSHGFSFQLPAEVFDGRPHHMRVHVGDVRLPSNLDEQPLLVGRADLAATHGRFQGKVEALSSERVSGWAADLAAPYRPVHVIVSVDGVVAVTAIANQFRARLHQAGKGSGNHYFDVALPTRFMNGKKAKVEVAIAESFGKAIIGGGTVAFSLVDFFGNRSPQPFSARIQAAPVSTGVPARGVRPGEPTVSLIVLNLDGEHLLPELLSSLARVTWNTTFEVILIDHGSVDQSLAIAERYSELLPLRIVRRNANYSFSESNNFGARLARGEYLALVNNDIVFLDDCLGPLCANLRDPSVGLVGLRLIEPLLAADGSSTLVPHHTGVKLAPSLAAGVEDGHVYLPVEASEDNGQPPGLHEVPAVTAALVVCRKADYMAVGGLDEGYVYGLEDVDLCFKLRFQLGQRTLCDTRLSALHQRSATRNRPKRLVIGANAGARPSAVQNRQRYLRRFGRKLTREVLSSLVAGKSYWRTEPLQITFAVTEAHINTAAGDFFTAVELGDALVQELGYRVMFLPMGNHEAPGTDVLIVMRHDYEIRKVVGANPGLITVAWIRNRVDQWLSSEQLDAYQVLLCSSQAAIDVIFEQTGRQATLLPIATNPDRFRPVASEARFKADVTFTGHYWGDNRDGLELINPARINGSLAIFGKEWSKCPAWHPHWRGQVPYADLPAVYSSSSLVIDDSHPVTRKWGSLNSRVFDALGSGKLVFTNCREGAQALFGDRLPTYASASELESLINHYLSAPAEREALARSLREEVLAAHTYTHRARTVQSTLANMLRRTLRFAIKVPVPKPENKERWGDYHFALGIQRALEARGHVARVDLIPEWKTGLSVCDDVVLVLRGLSAYEPTPRSLNLLWLISHPTDVPYSECEKFDHVFVASSSFSKLLSNHLEVPVSPLLQCTDPALFSPTPAAPGDQVPEVLFVGNSRGQQRRIIRDSVAANIDVGVYGSLWERFLPKQMWRGNHISNHELRRFYSNAKVVLNDHWPDMARHGFVSNRIFDAGACHAAIVSDEVVGLEDLFGDLVSTYQDASDLSRLVAGLKSDEPGRSARGQQLGDLIRQHHTFGHRVDEIVRVAERLLGHTTHTLASNGVEPLRRNAGAALSRASEEQP